MCRIHSETCHLNTRTSAKTHDCPVHGGRHTRRRQRHFPRSCTSLAYFFTLASLMSGVLAFPRTSKLSSFLFHIRPLHVCTPQNFKYLETLASPDSIVASWDPFPTKPIATTSWERLFDLQLPEGRCIGLVLSDVDPSHADALTPEGIAHAKHWIHDMLHPQEVSFGVAQPSHHARTSFFLGRLAMREALRLERHTSKSISILKDEHGRPTVPNGYLGSISHKGATGVALIATTTEEHLATGIGIDIEQTFSGRRSIAPRVLTEREQGELGRIDGVTADEEVLLRFSMKESLYKAMHPLICQYVGFQEAEVTPHVDGTATVVWNLKSGAHTRFGVVTTHWRRLGEYFLTSASVTLNEK